MGKSLLDKIQSKLELLRLEKRYTRSRHRRSAFVSNAVYVDGEYVFQTPNSTGSSTSTGGIDALHGDKARSGPAVASIPPSLEEDYQEEDVGAAAFQRKRLNRFSFMHAASPPQREVDTQSDEFQRKRLNRFSSMPAFGAGHDKPLPRVQERRLSMIR